MKVKTIIKVNKVVREEKIVNIGVNPLVKDLKIPVTTLKMKGLYKNEDGIMVPTDIVVEKTPFAKLFITPENRKLFNGIPDTAKGLFMWMIFEIKQGEDFIQINKSRCMKELSIKALNTYKTAINNLIRYGLIKDTKAVDTYWINSEFVFFGSRTKKYKNKLSKVEIKSIDEDEYPSNDNEMLNKLRPSKYETESTTN